jgi:hypothetical protein
MDLDGGLQWLLTLPRLLLSAPALVFTFDIFLVAAVGSGLDVLAAKESVKTPPPTCTQTLRLTGACTSEIQSCKSWTCTKAY